MDILIITPTVFKYPIRGYAGIEYLCEELALNLIKRGHNVDMIAPIGSKLYGVNMICLEQERGSELTQFENIKNLPLCNYDIIHDNTHLCLIYNHKYANDLPIVRTFHSDPYNQPKYIPPVKYPRTICISKWQQHAFRERWNIDSKLVYNGINPDNYDYNEYKLNRLLYFSRFSAIKGSHIAIDISRRLNIPIDLAGGKFIDDPNYFVYIERVAKETPTVNYLGEVDFEERRRLFSEDTCLMLPLLSDEPFGIVVIEAMMSGCIPIVMNRGSMSELIIDGKTGFLCNNVDEMIEAYYKIDTINRKDCLDQAKKFTIDTMTDNYLEIYKSVINGEMW